MRNFVKVFLFFILGMVYGEDFDEVSSELNRKTVNSKNGDNITLFKSDDNVIQNLKRDEQIVVSTIDDMFSKLKNADKETLLILNCENIVFKYLDTAFSKGNQNIWSDFSEKRSKLDEAKNKRIDQALFFAPKGIIDMKHKEDFQKIKNQGLNIVCVYQANEDRMKFRNDGMISSFMTSILKDLGLNTKKNASIKLLVTDSKTISSDIAKIVKELTNRKEVLTSDAERNEKTNKGNKAKVTSIKKIILVHDGSLNLDYKQINLPVKEILVNFQTQDQRIKLTEDQISQQLEILQKTGEWMDDWRIQRITNRSDEEVIYELCKQSIMDVCPCSEIIEEKIYEKIESIVKDKNSLKNLKEIIDDFQEIHNALPNIFHYVIRKYFWRMCNKLGIEENKSIEMLKKMEDFYFNEREVMEPTYKIVKRLGCGIHWRDMAKYEYIDNFIMTGNKSIGTVDSERHKAYMKIVNIVFDKVSSRINRMLEDRKSKFIRILHENKIEDSKIMNIFKISEEKFKNIITKESLKNEEYVTKDEKKHKKSEENT